MQPVRQRQPRRCGDVEDTFGLAVQRPVIGAARGIVRVVGGGKVVCRPMRSFGLPVRLVHGGIVAGDHRIPRAQHRNAVARPPFAQELEIDMLAFIMAGTAPVIGITVGIRHEAPYAGMPDLPRFQPQELPVGVVRTIGHIRIPTRAGGRIAEGQVHEATRRVQHGGIKIRRSLLERDALVILGIGELTRITVVIGDVVKRHAFKHVTQRIPAQPAYADIGLG